MQALSNSWRAAQHVLLRLLDRAQHRLAISIRQTVSGKRAHHLLPRDPQRLHPQLTVGSADCGGEDQHRGRETFAHRNRIIEPGLSWQHWNGSAWVDIDLSKLPGPAAIRKAGG